MAESMIERVARAIVENPPEERQESTPDGWRIIRNFERTARAAIEAMREPTEGMTLAGIKRQVAWDYGERGDPDEPPYISEVAAYSAMIDAALKETQP